MLFVPLLLLLWAGPFAATKPACIAEQTFKDHLTAPHTFVRTMDRAALDKFSGIFKPETHHADVFTTAKEGVYLLLGFDAKNCLQGHGFILQQALDSIYGLSI